MYNSGISCLSARQHDSLKHALKLRGILVTGYTEAPTITFQLPVGNDEKSKNLFICIRNSAPSVRIFLEEAEKIGVEVIDFIENFECPTYEVYAEKPPRVMTWKPQQYALRGREETEKEVFHCWARMYINGQLGNTDNPK